MNNIVTSSSNKNSLPSKLYVLRSTNKSVMGTGSVAFGFKNENDAKLIVEKVKSFPSPHHVWYTAVKPDKFVLTTGGLSVDVRPIYCCMSCISSDEFLEEMLGASLAVRIIEDIKVEHDFYTLFSSFGYEPFYSPNEIVTMLERHLCI